MHKAPFGGYPPLAEVDFTPPMRIRSFMVQQNGGGKDGGGRAEPSSNATHLPTPSLTESAAQAFCQRFPRQRGIALNIQLVANFRFVLLLEASGNARSHAQSAIRGLSSAGGGGLHAANADAFFYGEAKWRREGRRWEIREFGNAVYVQVDAWLGVRALKERYFLEQGNALSQNSVRILRLRGCSTVH